MSVATMREVDIRENDYDRVLLVEDDASLAELLKEELEGEGYDVRQASSVEEATPLLQAWMPALLITDLRLPGADGLTLLASATTSAMPPACLMITAFGTINQAVEALKAGADEFLTKPLQMEHFLLTANRLIETRRLRSEVKQYRAIMSDDHFHGIIGRSPPMRVLYEQIRQIAAAEGPVLVLGESGVGKELVARAIHAESPRAAGPFQAVNCAGIPSELMESEFFGHAAGAFTGARQAREGLFTRAHQGLLLLDEIAEMPIALQAKLLRALQDGRVRPVGGDREFQVDVRIIAATHQNLQEECQANRFREDLYYRLETFVLRVPPLRERGSDIELLAEHLLNQNRQKKQRPIKGFTREALDVLQNYSYPGNVRELQNAVERAVAFCNSSWIDTEHLPQRMLTGGGRLPVKGRENPGPLPSLQHGLPKLETVQQEYVHYVLAQTDGNKRKAAEILGITRRTLYRWLSDEAAG